jgi:glycosyltransferase involved in cell wall biosynthesis
MEIADEVIIIDASSTDKTVEIAKSYGEKVKVFIVDNPKNFLENKQRAIEKASGEWILQLDADEAISDGLKKEILKILKIQESVETLEINKDKIVGYNIPRKNWFLNRFLMKGGVYPDYVLRLYKKDKAHFNLKHLHENVVIDGEVGELNNAILHYADPNFSRYLLRWGRYTTFDAEELAKSKKSLNFFDFLNYFIIKPKCWFFWTYFRHKGFMDGFPGFVFSLFSSIRFWAIFIKAWGMKKK